MRLDRLPWRVSAFAVLLCAQLVGCTELAGPLPNPTTDHTTVQADEEVVLTVDTDDPPEDLFWVANPAVGTFSSVQGAQVSFLPAPAEAPRYVKIQVSSRRRLAAPSLITLRIVPATSPTGTLTTGTPAENDDVR
jgi:hypothetical protein